MKKFISSRRDFFGTTAAVATSIILPQRVMACLERVKKPIKLGMIADLHQDVMHDGPARLQAFLDAMKEENPDALIQLGDFAYPTKKNEVVSKAFEKAHPKTLHVLGNHEIDDGHSFDEVAKLWGMKGRYYTEHVNGLDLVVLDGNEKPENHQGGYPAHIGEEQLEWLAKQLKTLKGPILVICHQPLAGSYRNKSYPAEVHSKFQWVEYTCPYRDSLFTTLTIDPASGRIDVQGRESEWVGKSPSQLGIADKPDLTDGKEICPKIRSRQLGPAEK
jgi:Icc protein